MNTREGDARRYTLQRTRAHELHQLANVPEGPCGLKELRQFQAVLAPTYQLLVMSRQRPFSLIYKGPACPRQIRLIKANTHYDGCTSFAGFVNRSYWCDLCDKAFNVDDARHHSCQGRACFQCNRQDCPDKKTKVKPDIPCSICNGLFFGDSCLAVHYTKKLCQRIKTCPRCCLRYDKSTSKKRHVCGTAQCYSCGEWHPLATHRCYIQPEDDPDYIDQIAAEACGEDDESDNGQEKPPPLLVYADIETMLEEDGAFTPILLVYRTSEDEHFHVLKGEDCCVRFIQALDELGELKESDDDERREIIRLFHDLKGFDGIFILNTLYNDMRDVECQLTIGSKVLSFTSGNLPFKDSLFFLAYPLEQFPDTFNLTELKKRLLPSCFQHKSQPKLPRSHS